MNNRRKYTNESGVTLVETVISVAIISIGLLGVYTMVTASHDSMRASIMRQKMQMVANQMFEIMDHQRENIDDYDGIELENCIAPDPAETDIAVLRAYEWCSRLEGEIGTVMANDERSIAITVQADGSRLAHIILEGMDGKVQLVAKRVFDNPS